MQLNVRTMDGQQFSLTLLDLTTTTVLDIKKQLVTTFGQPDVRDQQLIYCGSVMKDNQALCDFKLNENTCIHLVVSTKEEIKEKEDHEEKKEEMEKEPCNLAFELEELCKLFDDTAATAAAAMRALTTIKTRVATF